MDEDRVHYLSEHDREILGIGIETESSHPPKTAANRIGDIIGYFILFDVLLALAAVIAMLLAKCVIIVYGWLF